MSSFLYHWCAGEVSRTEIEAFLLQEDARKLSKWVGDWMYIWEKYGHWDKNHIQVLRAPEGDIMGLHGATWNKRNPYMNTYAIYASRNHRRKGVARILLDWGIQVAYKNGNKRVKCKAYHQKDGFNFYTGLGFMPVAYNKAKDECSFDFDISGCMTLNDAIQRLKSGKEQSEPDPKDLKIYKSSDLYLGKW